MDRSTVYDHRQIAIGENRSVSAVIARPGKPAVEASTAVILAHGAGNDMNAPLLSTVHAGLARCGYVAVKFNFPYTERGARAPDPAPVLEACYARVIEAIRDDPQITPRRVVIGGKSLGGRMASHLAAKGEDVAGLIFLGYPLHPAGKPERLRAAHLDKIESPMLFFAGTRDPLCNLDLLEETIRQLRAQVALHVIEGADHSFNLPKRLGRDPSEVWEEIIVTSADWLARQGLNAGCRP